MLNIVEYLGYVPRLESITIIYIEQFCKLWSTLKTLEKY